MRVIVASTIVPFVEGGGTFIVDWLEEMLRRHGHEVEVFRIPFGLGHRGLVDRMIGLRLMHVSEHADRLVAIRTPSHLLRHPSKVLWFIHHVRHVYDLWGTRYQEIPDTIEGRALRSMVWASDDLAFREARHIFTNSAIVSRRLARYNRVDGEVLYPPVLDPERFRCDGYGDFVLCLSRIAHHKRQELAIEALAHTATPVRLVVAGAPDAPGYEDELDGLARALGVSERLTLVPRWIGEEEKIELLASCLGVCYAPFDEDSYGYPSLEAHHSGKAVITALDSGGTLELVEHESNGLVVAPQPAELARAMDRLWLDRNEAQRMGERGRRRIDELGIGWERVVERLLA